MAAKKVAGKKDATKKRKKEIEDDASNKRINTMFHHVDRDEYKESLNQKSTQTPVRDLSSQRSSRDTSPGPPTSSAGTSTTTHSQPTWPKYTPAELPRIWERYIIQIEQRFDQAYESYKHLPHEVEAASPRLLIACLGVLVIDRLKKLEYSPVGMFRAMSMEHNGVNQEAITTAWSMAREGRSFDIDSIAGEKDASPNFDDRDWEVWTTDAEAIELLESPIKAMGLSQMQTILQYSYRIACRLTNEAHFDPSFAILMYSMRYLARLGYQLHLTIRAMAMEILGKRDHEVEQAWEDARGEIVV